MSLQITQFQDGTIEIYNLSEEGGAQVTCRPDGVIELWLIPQYGGEPDFIDNFSTIQAALENISSIKSCYD